MIKKVIFKKHENRMSSVASTEAAKNFFKEKRANNLKVLLHERFNWMNFFINEMKYLIFNCMIGIKIINNFD